MKFALPFIVCLSMGFLSMAQKSNLVEKIVWKSYTDSASSFTVQYPSNWFLKLSNEKAVFVLKSPEETAGDTFFENLNLIVRYLPAGKSLTNEQLAGLSLDGLRKKYPSLLIKSSQKITWLKRVAWEISYEITEQDLPANILQKLIFLNDRLYVCTYTAQANKHDPFAAMAKEIFAKMTVK